MNQPDQLSAAILRRAAVGLTGFAVNDLLQDRPDLQDALAPAAHATWQGLLQGCVAELAAALALGRPQLFADHAAWLQSLLTARGVPPAAFPAALGRLRDVLSAELPTEAAAGAAGACEAALAGLAGELPETPSFLQVDTPQGRLAGDYLLALLEGDRSRAVRLILDAVEAGAAVEDIYLHVLLPAQQEVGRMWQADEGNVAEEHFVTATTKALLAQLRVRTPARASHGKTLLAAAVMDNQHDVGLQVVADFFEMAGWRVIALGSNMPIVDLAQAVEFYQPDLVAFSVALPSQLVVLRETIATVRRGGHGSAIKILAGGRGLDGAPELAEELGADGYAAEPLAAVAMGNRLVGLAK